MRRQFTRPGRLHHHALVAESKQSGYVRLKIQFFSNLSLSLTPFFSINPSASHVALTGRALTHILISRLNHTQNAPRISVSSVPSASEYTNSFDLDKHISLGHDTIQDGIYLHLRKFRSRMLRTSQRAFTNITPRHKPHQSRLRKLTRTVLCIGIFPLVISAATSKQW